MNHVSGWSLAKMRVLVQVKVCCSRMDLACHFAISVQRPSARLSALIEVAAIFGCGRVSRKFHASHASTVDFPGPLHACMAMRGFVGKMSRISSCQASGSTPNSSRTIELGFWRQALILSAMGSLAVTRVSPCQYLAEADRRAEPISNSLPVVGG